MAETIEELKQRIDVLERAYQRERNSRRASEKLGEKIAYNLFYANRSMSKLLHSVAEISERQQTTHELITEFLTVICQETKIPIGHIFGVDDSRDYLKSLFVWYIDPSVSIDEFKAVSEGIHFRSGEGLPGRVWQSGQSLWIPNIHKDLNFPRNKIISEDSGIRTGFAVPIKVRGQVEYVYEFFFNEEKNRIGFLVELIETIAKNIEQIIETRYYQEQQLSNLESLEKAHIELANLKEQAISSAKMSALGEMAAGIAHEINNPLTILRGKLSILHRQLRMKQNLSEEISKDFLLLEHTVDRIGKIVNSMRNLSKDSENEPFHLMNVNQLVRDTLDLCESKMAFRSIEFKFVMDENFHLSCRPTQISQVLLNLINNAIDAVAKSSSPTIQLTVFKKDSTAYFTLEDNGSGIPEDLREKVFQPFFTTKAVGQGTGLGLSISRKIIESHDGRLIYSFDDGRSIFSFMIPL